VCRPVGRRHQAERLSLTDPSSSRSSCHRPITYLHVSVNQQRFECRAFRFLLGICFECHSFIYPFIHSFIHFWHAPLGVRSTKRRHQSPEWTILSHVNCFIQGEVIGFQVLLGSFHPRGTRASWWSPPLLQRGGGGGC